MADTTHISWADMTFNPWVGCMKVSPACDGCYAEHLMATRHKRVVWGAPGAGVGTRDRTSDANWAKPLAWDRKAAKNGTCPFVFCSSLADVFDSDVPPEWRADLFDLIRRTPNLVWLLLTKRPGNILKLFAESIRITADERGSDREAWPRNAAIGCTVVTQEEADRDVPKLLAAKAALKPAFAFLSMEPLMGPVDLTSIDLDGHSEIFPLTGTTGCEDDGEPAPDWPALDWVITGGETDQGAHRARPSHPDWFRSIRDQCATAGVAYHHKQNGEWAPGELAGLPTGPQDCAWWFDDAWEIERHSKASLESFTAFDKPIVFRTGKRTAGRTLDGVIHDARPSLPTGAA